MNLWLANHYALPPSGSGPNRHHALASGLGARGHDVSVIASGFEHYARRDRIRAGATSQVEVLDGVRYVWLRTPPYRGSIGRARNIATFAARFTLLANRLPLPPPDVVFGSSPHLLTPFAAIGVARRATVPFVLEVRDIWPQSMVDLLGMSPRNPAVMGLGAIERYLYRNADRIVTVLPAVADYMVERGATREKIVWIPNGVDLSGVPAPRNPPDVPPFVVMYAGTLGLVNGLDVVLDAARVLLDRGRGDDVLIRLVGPGPARERLEQRVAQEGLVNVRIDQPVPKEQVHDVLAEAHAFLMVLEDSPVFRFGVSPNKLFDYFAASRPVLFAVRTDNNPVEEAGAGITVGSGDPVAMADGIEQLARLTPAEREAMGRRGEVYVRKEHDYDLLSGQLERVLQAVCSERLALEL
jgi:glycosyltransferase involved in cell wall biosynthesis